MPAVKIYRVSVTGNNSSYVQWVDCSGYTPPAQLINSRLKSIGFEAQVGTVTTSAPATLEIVGDGNPDCSGTGNSENLTTTTTAAPVITTTTTTTTLAPATTLSLGYHISSAVTACAAGFGTYYVRNGNQFVNSTQLFTNSGLTSIASNGYYSNGTNYAIVSYQGVLSDKASCTFTTTSTTTTTTTTSTTTTTTTTAAPTTTTTTTAAPTTTTTTTAAPTTTTTTTAAPTTTTTTTAAPTTTTTTTTTAAPTTTTTTTAAPTTTTTTTTAAPNTFNVTANGSANYVINGSSNPTLSITEGETYTFNINASGHPFWIKTVSSTGTGNSYSSGVTNNGTDNGTITFVVPYDAPSTLYYNCQLHSGMAGTINVTDVVTTTTTTTTAAPVEFSVSLSTSSGGVCSMTTIRTVRSSNNDISLSDASINGAALYRMPQNILITGYTYVAETSGGNIDSETFNINSSTGVVGSGTGDFC